MSSYMVCIWTLATSAARAHPGEIRLGDGVATDSRAARAKICEAVVASLGEAALSESPNDALEAFHDAVMAVAHGWPSAAPFLRELVDRFLRQSRPGEMGPLWRAFVALRQWA